MKSTKKRIKFGELFVKELSKLVSKTEKQGIKIGLTKQETQDVIKLAFVLLGKKGGETKI